MPVDIFEPTFYIFKSISCRYKANKINFVYSLDVEFYAWKYSFETFLYNIIRETEN